MKMKQNPPGIRAAGQRSIASTALFRSSIPNQPSNCKDGASKIKGSSKDSRVSLSDFLNNKLHKSSVLPNSIQGKGRPFSSPLSSKNESEGHAGVEKNEVTETKSLPDVVFQQFKCAKEDGCRSSSAGEIGISSPGDDQGSRKRKNPFADGTKSTRKGLVVLGEVSGSAHSTPKRIRKPKPIADEKPRQIYNHYANGGGFWDCGREGVDNEEVGCNEVWEGIGSTTLGGLDWH